MSQQVAADSIGIPRTAVTQLEAGNRAVSTLELAQLAELYKQPVADFFSEQPLREDDLLVALHRLAPGLDTRSDIKEQVERCLSLCREGCSLENYWADPREVARQPITCPRHERPVKPFGKVSKWLSKSGSGLVWVRRPLPTWEN
ncbi:MAG: helix-turn-helix transcriptional regulator [Candidatus Competibacteraceae bacterium]|nr:helix-turn-helix transcriptional regulator [Candidatus Competibacteraceae bacterium]